MNLDVYIIYIYILYGLDRTFINLGLIQEDLYVHSEV